MRVTVSIGKRVVTYVVCATTAHVAYDGFGTITLDPELETNDERGHPMPLRLVLVQEEHFGWQSMRYSSGLAAWTLQAGRFDSFDPELLEVEEMLWKRLQGGAV